ncbi:thioredoxin-like protein [Trametes maxima]|nr:thioredoxin-like protein [Trametes maxima]
MPPTEQITFYTGAGGFSPSAQRVHIALEDARADYTLYEVDVKNKPAWFYEVSPLGKVPAISLGPRSTMGQPLPESTNLTESLALLEYLADIYPEAKLLPSNPILRAKARSFTMLYQTHVSEPFLQTFFSAKPCDALLAALEQLQGTLPPNGFAAGEWSIADAAVIPFLARLFLYLEVGMGKYGKEDDDRMRTALFSERFARLRRYHDDARQRPSFEKTWGSDAAQIEIGRNLPSLRRG